MKRLALSGLVAALFTGLAPAALAQDGPPLPEPATAPVTAPGARWDGLPVAEITGRLMAAGLTVAPPRTSGDRVYLRVDDGPLRWVMTLFSCTDGACPDVQFTAVFSGPLATPEIVARWNGERRFVKAFHALPEEEGGEGQAVAQFDVLLSQGGGAAQLDDPVQVWRSLALDLGRTVNPAP